MSDTKEDRWIRKLLDHPFESILRRRLAEGVFLTPAIFHGYTLPQSWFCFRRYLFRPDPFNRYLRKHHINRTPPSPAGRFAARRLSDRILTAENGSHVKIQRNLPMRAYFRYRRHPAGNSGTDGQPALQLKTLPLTRGRTAQPGGGIKRQNRNVLKPVSIVLDKQTARLAEFTGYPISQIERISPEERRAMTLMLRLYNSYYSQRFLMRQSQILRNKPDLRAIRKLLYAKSTDTCELIDIRTGRKIQTQTDPFDPG